MAWGPGCRLVSASASSAGRRKVHTTPGSGPGGTWPQQGRRQTPERAPPPPGPLTEQTEAQPGQALPEPLAQALRELPPPLLLPVVVLLVQRQPVHVPGQARGQVGDGREGT